MVFERIDGINSAYSCFPASEPCATGGRGSPALLNTNVCVFMFSVHGMTPPPPLSQLTQSLLFCLVNLLHCISGICIHFYATALHLSRLEFGSFRWVISFHFPELIKFVFFPWIVYMFLCLFHWYIIQWRHVNLNVLLWM